MRQMNVKAEKLIGFFLVFRQISCGFNFSFRQAIRFVQNFYKSPVKYYRLKHSTSGKSLKTVRLLF